MSSALETAKECAKWVGAVLGVLLMIVIAPLVLIWKIFGPMVIDMKKVIDGEMDLW